MAPSESTSSRSPNSNGQASPTKRYDLVEGFNALALARGSTTPSGPPDHSSRENGTRNFVGGFSPRYEQRNSNVQWPPAFPMPMHQGHVLPAYPGPLPRPPPMLAPRQSLTMKHALQPPSPPLIDTGRPHSTSSVPQQQPGSGSATPSKTRPPVATPNRRRAASTPASPTSSVSGDSLTQCSGITKAGTQCTRKVKVGPPLTQSHPDADVARYCHQHQKEVMKPSGYYSRKTGEWLKFEDWIPDYLQEDTQAALRVEMEKARTQSDVPGYIYTFEIRDPKKNRIILLKVGRAVNLVKRMDQWGKQCGSKEQVLRGYWPGTDGPDSSLMKGTTKAGEKGAWCHRLERLVHLELGDLAVHAPYLDSAFPNAPTGQSRASASPAKRVGLKPQDKPCADCGTVHKEIFEFKRPERGPYKGKEWELLVKPVIEKWGAFVEAHV